MRSLKVLGVSSLLIVATAVVGCAFGNTAPVTVPAKFVLDYQGTGSAAVAVRDQRADVLSGDRKETLVGHQRSLYGIPYPVATSSGKLFATELADAIVRGLKAKGAAAVAVAASPFKPEDKAIDALVATGSDRLLLFSVVEWDEDTYSSMTLHYDIRLSVLDKKGDLLGQTAVAGEDDIKNSARAERRNIGVAFLDIISTLLRAKPIVAALRPDAAPTKTCTVEQILKMQESGLSRSQIEAACGTGGGR